jgi:hypothetical protein
MTGLKYKLAHKRVERERWNATDNAQRKRLIQILQELIDQLKMEEMVEEVTEKPMSTTLYHHMWTCLRISVGVFLIYIDI